MKNPFTKKLRDQIAALELERDQLRAENNRLSADHKTATQQLADVEPTIAQRASDQAIDIIASAGVLGPLPCGEGKTAAGTAPRTKSEFLAAYQRIEDPAEAAAYFDRHQALLD